MATHLFEDPRRHTLRAQVNRLPLSDRQAIAGLVLRNDEVGPTGWPNVQHATHDQFCARMGEARMSIFD